MATDLDSPRVAAVAENDAEAAMMVNHLESVGIKARISGAGTSTPFPYVPSGIQVVVREEDLESARESLNEIANSAAADRSPVTVDDETKRPIRLPFDLNEPLGAFTTGQATILAMRGEYGVACLSETDEIPEEPDWVADCNEVLFRVVHDKSEILALRPARIEDYRRVRLPVWIEYDATPRCCDQPMQFVGQIDDDQLWRERPAHARVWWHDAASFYVFTCPLCLSVKAVGQQC